MDLVLVGLPGSGKSVVGQRLAQRHGATFIDLDERIEHDAGRPIPEIFAEDGEAAFRRLERRAVDGPRAARSGPVRRRVIATGGGAIVDPRNRWALYRGRARSGSTAGPRSSPSACAARRTSGRSSQGAIRSARSGTWPRRRERFYAAADSASTGVAEMATVVDAVEARLRSRLPGPAAARPCSRASTPDRAARHRRRDRGRRRRRRRSSGSRRGARSSSPSPGAWAAVGATLATALARPAGRSSDGRCCPQGEDAKRLSVDRGRRRGELARLRVERDEPLVAVGGGALGDAAGFLAATYLRGVPLIHVPTTLVAQIDSSIGGKTGVDLPEGKNLVGAFHQPAAIVIDVAVLATLPERQRRAALGEAVKMAALGDERLFELLEADGDGDRRAATPAAVDGGAVAEVVERCGLGEGRGRRRRRARARPRGGRITLNLGPLARPRDRGRGGLRRRCSTARPWRTGCARRRGSASRVGVTPPERAARIERPARRARARRGAAALPARRRCSTHLATDKKHAGGRAALGPADGRRRRRSATDVPDERRASTAAGSRMLAARERRDDPRPRPPGPEPQPARDPRAGDLRLRDARRDPRRHRDARARARARGRLLPVEPRGRADRPAARSATSTSRSSTPAG